MILWGNLQEFTTEMWQTLVSSKYMKGLENKMDVYYIFFGEVYYGTISCKTGKKLSRFDQKELESVKRWATSRVYFVQVPY